MFSDVLPTGYETGVLNGRIKLGDVVAIVGAGPIGLSALLTAQFYGPSEIIMIDPDEYRLQVSKLLGATSTISERNENASRAVMQHTNNKGYRFKLQDVLKAYEIFKDAANQHTLKVILEN